MEILRLDPSRQRVFISSNLSNRLCIICNKEPIFQEMHLSNVYTDYRISQDPYKTTQDSSLFRPMFSYLHNPRQRYGF